MVFHRKRSQKPGLKRPSWGTVVDRLEGAIQ